MDVKDESSETQSCFHGVLRYGRESDWKKISTLSASPSTNDLTVWCEFCGAKAKPPLDFSKSPDPEDFCCTQYMELYKKVEHAWHSLQEHPSDASQDQDSGEEHRERTRPQDLFQQFAEECLRKSRRHGKDNEMPGCKVTSSGLFTTITFRLSDFVRSRTNRRSTTREDAGDEEKHTAASLCSSSLPAGFGLCLYQGHIQKLYSNGKRFLTTLPDGTTQVFYPSGNLAIITFADDMEGVCIILDDNSTSCPIRAYFQSSGLATCYHSNGRTWLHMDMWGGRTLNQDLSKRNRWKWTDYVNKPTPFKPLYISLNNNVGVRVRGQDSVVVTFLASGQQARFSVGTSSSSSTEPSELAPSLSTEDLMLQVSQLNARLALERLRWCLVLHSRRRKLPPGLISQGRKLLRLSSNMCMEEKDRDYMQQCLRDCQ